MLSARWWTGLLSERGSARWVRLPLLLWGRGVEPWWWGSVALGATGPGWWCRAPCSWTGARAPVSWLFCCALVGLVCCVPTWVPVVWCGVVVVGLVDMSVCG